MVVDEEDLGEPGAPGDEVRQVEARFESESGGRDFAGQRQVLGAAEDIAKRPPGLYAKLFDGAQPQPDFKAARLVFADLEFDVQRGIRRFQVEASVRHGAKHPEVVYRGLTVGQLGRAVDLTGLERQAPSNGFGFDVFGALNGHLAECRTLA